MTTRAKPLFARLRGIAGAILWPILRDEPSRAGADPVAEIRAMKWANVQLLLAEAFRLDGFLVKEIGGESADMVLLKDARTYLVDCRHWSAIEVGANAAGQLYGAMGRLDAKGGFVVTAGKYTPDALEFARGLNVELIAGRELARMLEVAKETISGALPIRPLTR
jgi:restriction system protein